MKEVKREAYQFCDTFISERLNTINKNIALIQEGLTSETKSSAGDKHETGRAQLQLEREKLGVQLAETQKMQAALAKINSIQTPNKIGLGSLVITSQFAYFIAISAGLFNHKDRSLYCISSATPMAKVLLEKQVGDIVNFNDQQIHITEIY